MTPEEKQKLNEKLAKWAGWHEEKHEISSGCFGLILLAPNEELSGHIGYIPDHTPNFTDSLDACFEWLVPKTKTWEYLIEWAIEMVHAYADGRILKDPALALAEAIEKALIGE